MVNLINEVSFLTATVKLKELLLLQHIEANPDTTQKELARIIKAAPSMVNVYLREYENNKYIKRDYISAKIVKYMITPEGVKRKNYLLITYLHELLKLYNLAEDNVKRFLRHLEALGYERILLYGAGEVAETILGIARRQEKGHLQVVGLIDDDPSKRHEKLLGYQIISREDIGAHDHDVVVITSYTFEDKIIEKLEGMGYPMKQVVRFFSG